MYKLLYLFIRGKTMKSSEMAQTRFSDLVELKSWTSRFKLNRKKKRQASCRLSFFYSCLLQNFPSLKRVAVQAGTHSQKLSLVEYVRSCYVCSSLRLSDNVTGRHVPDDDPLVVRDTSSVYNKATTTFFFENSSALHVHVLNLSLAIQFVSRKRRQIKYISLFLLAIFL